MTHVVLGTAGHIDHGKSTLVKALTGIDPDRLKEEKERGITIDLGFAFLDLPSGRRLGIVDVPGHERLIKNMLAGAGGIDLVLLVIAADEGIMPQTREHLAICDLLAIQRGLVALTKIDLVEPEWAALVEEEARGFLKGSFLEGCPIVPVSAKTGAGLDRLVEVIDRMADQVVSRSPEGILRLPIDRVFTLKGFGTVVTGTLQCGRIRTEEIVEILPAGFTAKVRGLHHHGRPVTEAVAGQRTAVNLQGVEKDQIVRGAVLTRPGAFKPTRVLDAKVRLLPGASIPLKAHTRIRCYLGTQEVMGRVVLRSGAEVPPGGTGYIRLRLEEPLIALGGDRFIARRYSPLETLGGGVILDPDPPARLKDRQAYLEGLRILDGGSLAEKLSWKIRSRGSEGMTVEALRGWMQADPIALDQALERLRAEGTLFSIEKGHEVHRDAVSAVRQGMLAQLEQFHRANPLKPGMSKEDLRGQIPEHPSPRLFNLILQVLEQEGKVAVEREVVRLAAFRPQVGEEAAALREQILRIYREAGSQPPLREELVARVNRDARTVSDLLRLLSSGGALVRISDALYFDQQAYGAIRSALVAYLTQHGEMTVAEFRDAVGTTRKYAVPLLEHFDQIRLTVRVGDKRVLGRVSSSS